MRRWLLLLGAAALLCGCRQQGKDEGRVKSNAIGFEAVSAAVDPFGWPILSRSDKQVGIVTTRLENRGVVLKLKTLGLPPGQHGVRIHEKAKCDNPGFKSAGGHWNWSTRKHGHQYPESHHAGDLGNLEVAADGSGDAVFVIPLKDWDFRAVGGWSVIIYAMRGDERTDPSGSSGGERIACGIFYLRRDGPRNPTAGR